jgi:hypothetical protein
MSLFGLRAMRISPNIIDDRIAAVVGNLKTTEFLKGTQFEARAVTMGADPYSLLIGIIIGVAGTLVLGIVTLELWLPAYLSKLTGRTIAEATKAVTTALAGVM